MLGFRMYWGYIGIYNGKEDGNYRLGFRVESE